VKVAHSPENLHEDFLGHIGSIGTVLHGAGQEGIYRLVEACDEPRKSLLRAGSKFRNQGRLIGLKRQRAGNITHGEVRLQLSILPPYRNSVALGMRKGLKKPMHMANCAIFLRPLVRQLERTFAGIPMLP
jgi:hypothetical protein